MPYRKSLLLLILILPYFHGCQVCPSVIFYDHPFQIIPPPFFCTPISNQIPKSQNKYPKLKTELNVAENSIYIYDNNHPHLFSVPQAPGVVPKIGVRLQRGKKKILFADDEKHYLSYFAAAFRGSRTSTAICPRIALLEFRIIKIERNSSVSAIQISESV